MGASVRPNDRTTLPPEGAMMNSGPVRGDERPLRVFHEPRQRAQKKGWIPSHARMGSFQCW
jgi:hypothetical protein